MRGDLFIPEGIRRASAAAKRKSDPAPSAGRVQPERREDPRQPHACRLRLGKSGHARRQRLANKAAGVEAKKGRRRAIVYARDPAVGRIDAQDQPAAVVAGRLWRGPHAHDVPPLPRLGAAGGDGEGDERP